MSQDRIMYVCESCADQYPEGCGHYDRNELRITSGGRWLCEPCYENDEPRTSPAWRDLPAVPEYAPR